MVKRRSILKLLGLAGLGGVGYTAYQRGYVEFNIPDSEQSTPATQKPDGNSQSRSRLRINQVYNSMNIDPSVRDPKPTFDFDYEPVDAEIEESDMFAHVEARPTESENGDQLRIQPAAIEASELAGKLRMMWSIGTEQSVNITLSGETVTLSGGSYNDVAALIGTGEGAVIAARGSTTHQAREAANNWDL